MIQLLCPNFAHDVDIAVSIETKRAFWKEELSNAKNAKICLTFNTGWMTMDILFI